MERLLAHKIYDIREWPIQVVLYDEKGRRLISEYCPHEDDIPALIRYLKERLKGQGRKKPAMFIAISREVVSTGTI